MGERRRIPGEREVRATLDGPAAVDADAVVVACPPHPRMGGSRADARLRAVGDALAERSVACLRIDYGSWDEGRGEQRDVRDALAWAGDAYGAVGLFGYSFGAGVALLAAAEGEIEPGLDAVSVLAPPSSIVSDDDVPAAVDAVADRNVPGQVLYGERDDTVDWEPVVERAHERGWTVSGERSTHFFAGSHSRIATAVAEFVARHVPAETS